MKLSIRFLTQVIFGIALIFSLAIAQGTAQIKVSERRTLAVDQVYHGGAVPFGTTYQLTPTLVYFTRGDWPRDTVVSTAHRAAEILKQCGVLVQQVELVRVDAPSQYYYFDTPVSRELARALQLPKPTVYFMTDTRQQPAFDAEAIGRANSRTRPELADSVWLTRATRDAGIALAHELVHVLTDNGEHLEQPGNLMRARTSSQNTQLTDAQCTRMRDVGASNGLLRGRGG